MKEYRKYQHNFSEMLAEQMYDHRGSERKAKLAQLIVNRYYWLRPTYIWLLKKPHEHNRTSQK